MLRLVVSFCVFMLIAGHVAGITRSLDLYELQSGQGVQNAQGGHSFYKRALKIANGQSIPSDVNQRFPYSVLLVFGNETTTSDPRICAGVLIQPQWVLTAGSCVQSVGSVRDIYVGFGDLAPRPADLIGRDAARLVIGREVFPGFNGNPRRGSDLALLYLKVPVDEPVPMLPVSDAPLGEGQRLVGLGWGVTEVNTNSADRLQVADRFRYMDQESCEQVWDQVNNVSAVIDQRVICVWPRDLAVTEASMSICDGDEGGPLLFLDTTSFDFDSRFTFGGNPSMDIVYGIASFGPSECGKEEFSVYTNIIEYMDWINETISTYDPPNYSTLLTPKLSDDEGDEDGSTVEMVVLVGSVVVGVIGVALFLTCLVRFYSGRSSNLSADVNSVTSLRRAEEADRRQQHIALMAMSPFLASPELEASPNATPTAGSSPYHLPIDVRVTLIGHQLGSGAFGHVEEGVYVDEDGIRHKVAVKFNFGEEQSKDTLLNEIRIFERVGQHPNIVHCFGGRLNDSVDDVQECCIIEELMATDLGRFFKDPRQRKRLTYGTFLEIFLGIANGLEHLHKCEVIHFDLKPSNILLDDKQHPKLADFGCSRQRAHSYITAGARGTVAYMAPELWLLGMYVKRAQVRAEKVDVFSFGVVMWEVVTNQNPKDPLSMKELLMDSDSIQSTNGTISEGGTNEDFRSDRFPFETSRCPDPLKALIWDCVSYYNNLRPTVQEVKERISALTEKPWVNQNLDSYRQ